GDRQGHSPRQDADGADALRVPRGRAGPEEDRLVLSRYVHLGDPARLAADDPRTIAGHVDVHGREWQRDPRASVELAIASDLDDVQPAAVRHERRATAD